MNTVQELLADPASNLSRNVAAAQEAMTHNPQGADEWADYMAWQAEQARTGGRDFTTKAWRNQRNG